jgi:hypothetical protein
MKKLLIALFMFAGFAALAPQAEAGQYAKIFRGYDHCGRPIYTYVHKSEVYCAPHHGRSYSNHNYNMGKYNQRYYSGHNYNRGYYAPVYRSGPRFSVNFGF